MLALVNCIRSIEEKPGSLVTMIVALFFAEHRSAANARILLNNNILYIIIFELTDT